MSRWPAIVVIPDEMLGEVIATAESLLTHMTLILSFGILWDISGKAWLVEFIVIKGHVISCRNKKRLSKPITSCTDNP